jgi:hypothetical protein
MKTSKKGIIMSNTSGVTVGEHSTDVILGSVKEPAVRTIRSGQQRANDNQKWSWILAL